MPFARSEEQQMLHDTLVRLYRDAGGFEARRQTLENGLGYDRDRWSQLCELGVPAALLPESQGGFGGDGGSIAAVFEALGGALATEPVLAFSLLGARLLAESGGDAGSALSGESPVALAHTESGVRYHPHWVASRAQATDGGWRLRGEKSLVLAAASADRLLISARLAGGPGDPDGIGLFLAPVAAEGLSLRAYDCADGSRAADLAFECTLPESALLAEQAGELLAMSARRAALALSSEALGTAEALVAMTRDYLLTREQFGGPIARFQALQHRYVDLLVEIEQLRSAVIAAADALDTPAGERAVSAAKYLAGTVGRQVAEEAIQLHGGIGMTWEAAAPHYAKRLVMIDHQFGDEDFHLQRFAALGREAQTA